MNKEEKAANASKLEADLSKGIRRLLVLTLIQRGYNTNRAIMEQIAIKRPMLCCLTDTMKNDGEITLVFDTTGPGKAKRIYEITEKGIAALKVETKVWESFKTHVQLVMSI